MKRFRGFLIKEFIHIFRDVRTMMILFLIPIAQILIFGYVIKNEIHDANVAVLDLSKDNITKEISGRIDAAPDFVVSDYLNNYSDIKEYFSSGKGAEVIVFEPNFAENFYGQDNARVQLILDASDPNLSNLINNYTSAIIQTYIADQNMSNSPNAIITTEPRMWFNEGLKSSYMFVPGTMTLILMLITAMMTSITIVREKEIGTMEILLVSPLKPLQIILGKVTPYILLSIINAISIILLGNLIFHVPIIGSTILLLGVSILFIIMALMLGVFISSVTKTQQIAMFISMFALMLPTILLSGFIFPIENMPKVLQWLSYIVPAKYYLIAIKNIMLKGVGVAFIWKEILVLMGMTFFFLILSVKKFKLYI
ncbi:MAG: ABC transporter permease [Bacteroidales bacterium]|nr:ABC transporter permease [Bacteroidales bacterium]